MQMLSVFLFGVVEFLNKENGSINVLWQTFIETQTDYSKHDSDFVYCLCCDVTQDTNHDKALIKLLVCKYTKR